MLHHISITSLAVVLLVGIYSSPIHAGDSDAGKVQSLCNDVSMKGWESEKTILKKIKDMGLKPLRIKVEKGCWQVDALNNNAERVEIYIHPTSGKTVMLKVKGNHVPPADQ